MPGWRDRILENFIPELARLTLAADPDGLLLEESIQQQIRQLGFHLLLYDDPVTFRYAYESKYRSQWDRGQKLELVVVFKGNARELEQLPYAAPGIHVP